MKTTWLRPGASRANPSPAAPPPSRQVLLVGRIRSEILRDLEGSLPDCRFHHHTVFSDAHGQSRLARLTRRKAESKFGGAERRLQGRLRDLPSGSVALAMGSPAQRVLQATLHGVPEVVGFDSPLALKLFLQRQQTADLTPARGRLLDSGFTYEAVEAAVPRFEDASSTRMLLVAASNQYGEATSIATAVTTFGDFPTTSLSTGSSGAPADLMVSTADKEQAAIQEELSAVVGHASHLLLTPEVAGLIGDRHGNSTARLLDFGVEEPSASDPETTDFTSDPRRVSERTAWLPIVIPGGIRTPSTRIESTVRVAFVSSGSLGWEMARLLSWVGVATGSRLINLTAVDQVIRLQTAASADFCLDLRATPDPDAEVLAALAGGAVLISEFRDWSAEVPPPPHLERGNNPIQVLWHALTAFDPSVTSQDGRNYILKHHDGRRTTSALTDFLGNH